MNAVIAKRLLRTGLVRALISSCLSMGAMFGRAASAARAATLFPGNPDVFVHWSAEVKYPDRITVGQGVIIGPNSTIGAASPVVLGDHVHLSKGATVETAGLDFSQPLPYPHTHRPITIEDGVWIGTQATILGGVTIGARSVIGAGTVVTKDVPPDTIVAGRKMWPRVQRADESPKFSEF